MDVEIWKVVVVSIGLTAIVSLPMFWAAWKARQEEKKLKEEVIRLIQEKTYWVLRENGHL